MKTAIELTKEERVRNDSVAFGLFARSIGVASPTPEVEHKWRELTEAERKAWRLESEGMIDYLEAIGIVVRVKSESKMMAAFVTRVTFPARMAYDLGE